MNKFNENITVLSIGGILYTLLEYVWRGYSHWSMMLTGSVCFFSLYKIFNKFKDIAMPQKCLLGSLVITTIEFCVGCIVNLKYRLGVWDYSNLKFNLLGQVSVLYSVLWGFLCIPVSVLVQKLRGVFKKYFQ